MDDAVAHTMNVKTEGLKVVLHEMPTYLMFTIPDNDISERQEVVLAIHGIITKKDLPPFITRFVKRPERVWIFNILIRSSPDKDKRPFMKQGIQITGINTPLFDTCIQNLQHLNQILARQLPEGTIEPFTPGSFLNYSTIDIGTRYFTSRDENPLGLTIPFDRLVDPKGFLTSMNDSNYFHGDDNRVLYYMLSCGDKQRR